MVLNSFCTSRFVSILTDLFSTIWRQHPVQPPWCRLAEPQCLPLISVYLRICRAPSAPDVEGLAVCSSRVHSRSNYVTQQFIF